MGSRVSRLSRAVAGSASQAESQSSTAATPPQFLAAQKASAVHDASRRVLLDDAMLPTENPLKQPGSSVSHAVAAASNMREARLQDALGRGGGGGHEGQGVGVTDEELRNAYSVQAPIHILPRMKSPLKPLTLRCKTVTLSPSLSCRAAMRHAPWPTMRT